MYRGGGPRGITKRKYESFDDFLLKITAAKGAMVVRDRVEGIERLNGRPLMAIDQTC